MEQIQLNNGQKMPIFGLGTWKSKPGEVYQAVRWALKLGYTHFDCAAVYGNQEEIGQALHDAFTEDNLQREDLFISSKLWNDSHAPEDGLFGSVVDTLAGCAEKRNRGSLQRRRYGLLK